MRIAALDRVDAVELLRSCLYDMGITIDYRDVAVASAYRVDSQLFNKMLRRKIRALEGETASAIYQATLSCTKIPH